MALCDGEKHSVSKPGYGKAFTVAPLLNELVHGINEPNSLLVASDSKFLKRMEGSKQQ